MSSLSLLSGRAGRGSKGQRRVAAKDWPLHSTQRQGPPQMPGGHGLGDPAPPQSPVTPSAPRVSTRRGGMIQTCEQYQFVHHVMSLYEKQLSRPSPE